jgi:hypothetical protein
LSAVTWNGPGLVGSPGFSSVALRDRDDALDVLLAATKRRAHSGRVSVAIGRRSLRVTQSRKPSSKINRMTRADVRRCSRREDVANALASAHDARSPHGPLALRKMDESGGPKPKPSPAVKGTVGASENYSQPLLPAPTVSCIAMIAILGER